jgi:hypothetical protein
MFRSSAATLAAIRELVAITKGEWFVLREEKGV